MVCKLQKTYPQQTKKKINPVEGEEQENQQQNQEEERDQEVDNVTGFYETKN